MCLRSCQDSESPDHRKCSSAFKLDGYCSIYLPIKGTLLNSVDPGQYAASDPSLHFLRYKMEFPQKINKNKNKSEKLLKNENGGRSVFLALMGYCKT